MRPRIAITFAISTFLIFVLVPPVSALYFDFQYFETDQLAYEVGETIGMVAKMVADYGDGGWCYISFAVVTDRGPVFDDDYFISPSLDPRYFTSAYTITPEDTSPYPDTVTAYVIFNVEIFDKYYQGASETIEVNITRGHVQIYPLGSLVAETNNRTSISLNLASRYNENVGYANQTISVKLLDSNSTQVFENITETDANGLITLNWDSIPYAPGEYTIQIEGNGTTAFLPFSESKTLTIIKEFSRLNRITNPDPIYSMTPTGNTYEDVEITVEHVDRNDIPINESQIKWATDFASGMMTSQDNGIYTSLIPFNVTPGSYQINITTLHPLYQNATDSIPITVLQRNLTVSVICKQIPETNRILIDTLFADWQSGEPIESYTLNLIAEVGSWQFNVSGITNSSGYYRIIIEIPESQWGSGTLYISSNSTIIYSEKNIQQAIDICYVPSLNHSIVNPIARGEYALIQVLVQNPLFLPSSGIQIELHNQLGVLLASGTTNQEGIADINWFVPFDTAIGPANYTLYILENEDFVQNISRMFPVFVYYPLYISSTNTTWSFVRGTLTIVDLLVESEYGLSQLVELMLNDSYGEIAKFISIQLGVRTNVSFDIGIGFSLGPHSLAITVLNPEFTLLQSQYIDSVVLTAIFPDVSNVIAYYKTGIEFNLFVQDDINHELDTISMRVYLPNNSTPIGAIEEASTTDSLLIPIPEWMLPGVHQIIFEIYSNFSVHEFVELTIVVWMRTSLFISIATEYGGGMIPTKESTLLEFLYENTTSMISSGSISRPPPILFNGTTSIESPTALETSPMSCPRFNSGTSNFSTDSANSLKSLFGNGQSVLSLKDLKDCLLSIMASSTDLEVHPKDTTPHFAESGPDTTASNRRPSLLRILFPSRRISLS